MEKRKAHYNLDQIKTMIKSGHYQITAEAKINALQDFAYGETEILDTVNGLKFSDLFKSMTTHYDNKLWQDVYKKNGMYIKLQIIESAIIIQFKRE